MKKKIQVNVTKELIEKAKGILSDPLETRCTNCPVALAINKATGRSVSVIGSAFRFEYTDNRFSLPYEVDRFVINFDNDREVNPFSFEIEIPEEELVARP